MGLAAMNLENAVEAQVPPADDNDVLEDYSVDANDDGPAKNTNVEDLSDDSDAPVVAPVATPAKATTAPEGIRRGGRITRRVDRASN
jgi:hypothetical protein